MAGACCIIKSTNAFKNTNQSGTLTLNINSTGAKTCNNGGYYAPTRVTYGALCIYDGTRYIWVGGETSTYYNDYSDYGDGG